MRPLSGNVFMWRSSKHGWVAKAYPDSRQKNWDIEEFPSSSNLESESLDSFFDDDFEEQEKLGNLLSCNTLGVETKVRATQHWTLVTVPP